ncbi:tryptophan halogenase family protein [Paraglaciecola sp.]|uniref:tryptophan halogenase family protein n=1 Tax=Paraglaciecola sp. TaxID=1920173 RepID=UPI003EF52484
MSDKNLRNIVIVGGGTAGWMTAAALGRFLKNSFCKVRLIESEDIPSVGVGEATIPQIQVFNRTLGIDENEFIRRTQGTFKLGIEFENWGKIGESYIHAFGDVGNDMDSVQFYHYWWKMRQKGQAPDIGAYSLNAVAAPKSKFMRSVDAGNSPLSNIVYAYQFDAGLYAEFLREFALKHDVKRTQAKVVESRLRASDGFIESVVLDDGEVIEADLFIDCSGFRGLLIEKALNTGFDDWTHWLPCDSAWAVPCERTEPLLPYTRSTAHSAGWQWRIPLQHRTGNGHVFASQYMNENQALDTLLNNLPAKALADPKLLKFTTGKRKKIWNKNCIAVGLSSGFMEPLESTSIHLIQSTIARLMSLFPNREFNQHDIDLFNSQADFEYERIRDFIILHYKATQRDDSEFWNYCRTMSVPDTLNQKISQFMENGQIHRTNMELFNDTSWLEVFHGQGFHPKGYHPLVDVVPDDELTRRLEHIKKVIDKSVDAMPSQQEFMQHSGLVSALKGNM